MDIGLDSSVTGPPQQSPSVRNIDGTAGTRSFVCKPKRSRKRRKLRHTRKRLSRPRPIHMSRSNSSSGSQADSPSFANTWQNPQEEVSYMQFGNPSLCNRYWETYARACQWQQQHQIRYWKSRAIILQNENNKLRACFESKSNLCQPNVQQCEPSTSGPTQQYTFPQYYVPNDHLQGQMNEQANTVPYRPMPVEIDQPSTNQYRLKSKRPGPSRCNTPKINDSIGTPSYFWDESNRIGEAVDHSYPSIIANENSEDDEEFFEFEINEGMMAFLEQSMKHKSELKEQRERDRLENEKEKQKYENECFVPPQLICKQRNAEMKLLYGAGAPKIIAMETSVKLTFDRRLRQHDPKLWPVIPLRP